MATYVIELGDDRNRSFHWHPNGAELRGRASVQNFRPSTPDPESGIHEMPDIPGMMIELDTTARRARVFDPLGLPEMRQRLDEINRVWERVFRQKIKPVAECVLEDMSDLLVNTWQYWMWRFVTAKTSQATVLSAGPIPEVDGEVIHNSYDWSEVGKKTKRVRPKGAGREQASGNQKQKAG